MKDSLALLEHLYRLETDQYRSYIHLFYLESMPPNGTCSLENLIVSVDCSYTPSNILPIRYMLLIEYCKMMRDVPEGVKIPPIDPSLAECTRASVK